MSGKRIIIVVYTNIQKTKMVNELKKNGKFKTEFVRAFKDYDDALNHLNYNPSRNPRAEYYESIVQIGNSKNNLAKMFLKLF